MTDFSMTHRHVKSGKDYKLLGIGRIQTDVPLTDMAEIAIYQGAAMDLWGRNAPEFLDRFVELPLPEVPIGIEFISNANVPPGVAVAVHNERLLFLGPAAQMPTDPRVPSWPAGVVVNLHPRTHRAMADLAAKSAKKFEL